MPNASHQSRSRKGVTLALANDLMREPNYFGPMMVKAGDADTFISGLTYNYPEVLRPALQVVGAKPGRWVSSVYVMLVQDRVYFFTDASVIIEPTAEQLAAIALNAAELAIRFGQEPRIAMLSFSNFGRHPHAESERVRKATELVRQARPISPSMAKCRPTLRLCRSYGAQLCLQQRQGSQHSGLPQPCRRQHSLQTHEPPGRRRGHWPRAADDELLMSLPREPTNVILSIWPRSPFVDAQNFDKAHQADGFAHADNAVLDRRLPSPPCACYSRRPLRRCRRDSAAATPACMQHWRCVQPEPASSCSKQRPLAGEPAAAMAAWPPAA